MIADLSYNEAFSNIEKTLVQGRAFKADVHISKVRGTLFIIKDFGRKGFLERNVAGRLVTWREYQAYRSLSGIEGLPGKYSRLSPFSIAIEYLEGRDLGGISRGEVGPEVIRQFEAMVQKLHASGWVHLDLQRRSNILLVSGKVFVIDLASAVHTGAVPLVGRFLTALFGFADRMSLVKMKSLYAPDLLTKRERIWLRIRNLTMPRKW